MLVLRLAFRNIFRQRRRSLLTGMMMAMGFAIISISMGMVDGMYGDIIQMFTLDHTGHIQVHKKGYLDKPTLYKSIKNMDKLASVMDAESAVRSWSSRVKNSALMFKDKKTTAAQVIGIEPAREKNTTRIAQKVTEGRYLTGGDDYEVMVGNGIRKVLSLSLGDSIVLISQGADGSIANDLFKVVGFVGGENDSYNRNNCYLSMNVAKEYFTLGDRIHEVVAVLDDYGDSIMVADKIRAAVGDESLEVAPWEVVEKEFFKAMQADKQGNWVTLGIIMFIVALGVLNSILMTILERTREFGVLKALGTRPGFVGSIIVLESLMLSMMSMVFGAGLGILVNYLLSQNGIELPEPLEYGGIVFDEMKSAITWDSLWIPAAVVFFTSILVSLWPAYKAATVTPSDALRSN